MEEKPLVIPHKELAPATLQAILEEFITREGTDYGSQEITLERKVSQVLKGIEAGDYLIIFDQSSQGVHLITKQQWQNWSLEL